MIITYKQVTSLEDMDGEGNIYILQLVAPNMKHQLVNIFSGFDLQLKHFAELPIASQGHQCPNCKRLELSTIK